MSVDWQEVFAAERPRLFALAYRMLGSGSAAEDILQDAWLRVRGTRDDVRSPPALLTTVVTRLCLDELKSARRTRETYPGPWLPEPVLAEAAPPPPDASDRVDEAESLSIAFLLLLESLSPLERAVFLLREVFEYEFREISAVLGRSEAACRQLFHRARGHVAERRPRFRARAEDADRLARAFLSCVTSGDVASLEELLAEDVLLTSDGGGLVPAARRPVRGRDRVARLLVGLSRKVRELDEGSLAWINGQPGLVATAGGRVIGVIVLEGDGQLVRAVRVIVSPEKLAFLGARFARLSI